eukprot:6318769-Alexandrium_andersonii.AAC.1
MARRLQARHMPPLRQLRRQRRLLPWRRRRPIGPHYCCPHEAKNAAAGDVLEWLPKSRATQPNAAQKTGHLWSHPCIQAAMGSCSPDLGLMLTRSWRRN